MGIPFLLGGRSFDGCDCYGLVCLVFEEEFGICLNQYSGSYDDGDTAIAMMQAHVADDWFKVDGPPQPGDAAMMWATTREIVPHVGIVTSPRRVLTTSVGRGVTLYELDGSPIGRFMKNRIVEYRRNVKLG